MKKFPDNLTPSQKTQGQSRYKRYVLFNSFSVTCLMSNVLILYAIRNNMSDFAVACVASFLYLAMPFILLGKRLVSRWGAARSWGLCWALRYVAALFMILAPVVANIDPAWAQGAVILIGSFLFFGFRAMGMIAHVPMLGEISSSNDHGRFISGNWLRFNIIHLASMIAVILIIRRWDNLQTYQYIILVGTLFGFIASYELTRLPESRIPRDSAHVPILGSLKTIWNTPSYSRLIIALTASMISIAIVNPFAMIALKKGYNLADHMALIFSLLNIAGGIAASFVSGIISDHVGPRPLLIMNVAGIFLVAIFWALAPVVFLPILVGLVFFSTGLFSTGIRVTQGHYFLSAVEESERVGVGLFSKMATGFVAGLAGALGGILLKILGSNTNTGLELYKTYFLIISLCLIPLLIATWRLERLKEWKIRSILGLVFSLRDIRTLFALNQLEETTDQIEDARNVDKLGAIGSNLSEDALLEYLGTSRLMVRAKALRALQQIDFGKNTTKILLDEIQHAEFTTAWLAAEILGERGTKDAIPALRKALDSEDLIFRGKSMVALARLQDTDFFPEIKKRFKQTLNQRVIIHGANALAIMGDHSNIQLILNKVASENLSSSVVDEALNACATLCNCGDNFYRFLKSYNANHKQGLEILYDIIENDKQNSWLERLKKLINEECATENLRLFLLEINDKSSSPYSKDIGEFLHPLPNEKLQPKITFCIAMLLS